MLTRLMYFDSSNNLTQIYMSLFIFIYLFRSNSFAGKTTNMAGVVAI